MLNKCYHVHAYFFCALTLSFLPLAHLINIWQGLSIILQSVHRCSYIESCYLIFSFSTILTFIDGSTQYFSSSLIFSASILLTDFDDQYANFLYLFLTYLNFNYFSQLSLFFMTFCEISHHFFVLL